MRDERSGEEHQHAVSNSPFRHDPGEPDQKGGRADDGDDDTEAKHRAGRQRDVIKPLHDLRHFHGLKGRKRQSDDSRRPRQALRTVLGACRPTRERGDGEARHFGEGEPENDRPHANTENRQMCGQCGNRQARRSIGVEAGKPNARPQPIDRQAAQGDCPASRVAKQRACHFARVRHRAKFPRWRLNLAGIPRIVSPPCHSNGAIPAL